MENLENQRSVDGRTGVFETEGLGRRIYARHLDVPCISPWTPGSAGPGSILRFGMERFALADSIQRRWAGGSSFAYDRASLQHVAFLGAPRKPVTHGKSVMRAVSARVSGPDRSPSVEGESAARMEERIEAHGEPPTDQERTTHADSAVPLLQAKPLVGAAISAMASGHTLTHAAPAGQRTSSLQAKLATTADPITSGMAGANDLTSALAYNAQPNETASHVLPGASPMATKSPLPEVAQTNSDTLRLKSSTSDPVVCGPIIRQRSRAAIQPKRESVSNPSRSGSPLSLSETQSPLVKSDSIPSAEATSVRSLQTRSVNPDSVPTTLVKALPSSGIGGAVANRSERAPVAVLRRAATLIPDGEASAPASRIRETEEKSADLPQGSSLSSSTPIPLVTIGTRYGGLGKSANPPQTLHPSSSTPIGSVSPGSRDANLSGMILRKRDQADVQPAPQSSTVNAEPVVADSHVQRRVSATDPQPKLRRHDSPMSSDAGASGNTVPQSSDLLSDPPVSMRAKMSEQPALPTPIVTETPQRGASPTDLSKKILHHNQNKVVKRSMDVRSSSQRSPGSTPINERSPIGSAGDDGGLVVQGHSGPASRLPAITIQRSPFGSAAGSQDLANQGSAEQAVLSSAFTHSDFSGPGDTSRLLRAASEGSYNEVSAGSGHDFGATKVTSSHALAFPHYEPPAVGLAPIVPSFARAPVHRATAGQLLRRAAHGDAVQLTNSLSDSVYSGSLATAGPAVALTHRESPVLNANPILMPDIRLGASSPDRAARLQRVAAQAGGETGMTPATQPTSLPEQSGVWSRTQPAADVASLANRVYDLLVRRLASERQRRGH